MRIAIVNDLKIAVEALRRIITSEPVYEIAWIAYNGAEAIERCREDTPDLILMDLIMPVMDGVQATCTIMKENPCAILIVTATVSGNAPKVFEAMGCGALDAVGTPVFGTNEKIEGGEELFRKIRIISKLISKNNETPEKKLVTEEQISLLTVPPMVAIGCSTGGPKALSVILSSMPPKVGASIVIIQHVDFQFASGLAEWLNNQTELKVTLAREGMYPEEDVVYIAETNDHLILSNDCTFHYTIEPKDNPYRPSIDTFFQSINNHWPRNDIAVLLTGIGKDGAVGLFSLRQRGWDTIVQDKKTSVVFGMPKTAIEIGAAKEILPLEKIEEALMRNIQKRVTNYDNKRK